MKAIHALGFLMRDGRYLRVSRALLATICSRRSLLVLLAATLTPARAADSREGIHLVVGSSTVIAITENPSTGYRWSLNKEASTNLALVAISDAGFDEGTGKPVVGAPGTRRFRIEAQSPGVAVAVFDYIRSWEHVPASQRHIVDIQISSH